jgi:hypothetical protein
VIRRGGLAVAVLLAGCSSFEPTEDGIAILEIRRPTCNGVELGQSIHITALPLDQDRQPVDVPVFWQSPDSVIAIDDQTGAIEGLLVSDTARVQAVGGTAEPLVSDFIALVVTPFADTLHRSGDARLVVNSGTLASSALAVTLRSQVADTGVKAFPLVYRVVEPVFATFEDRTVELSGGRLTSTVCTAPGGAPALPVTLNRRTGKTAPDSAIVEVMAHHPDSTAVPGSGQRFIVVFLP